MPNLEPQASNTSNAVQFDVSSSVLPGAESTSSNTVVVNYKSASDLAGGTPKPTLQDLYSIMQYWSMSTTLLTGQVQAVQEDVTLIHHDLQKLQDRANVHETQVSGIADTVSPLKAEVNGAINQINGNTAKVEDLENRLHWNNARVVGLPEKV